MSQCPGVYNHAIYSSEAILQIVDQRSLMVGLKTFHVDTNGCSDAHDTVIDRIERQRTIVIWIAPPQHIQVGPMQNEDRCQVATSSR